ncbi:MAG: branched-chain amino acid ABC transporter permease, partial [Chloroflexota bacterium]|nr:branched-chain amino acid ABC transporter permease [Chloroflexota bacterium]
MSELAAAYVIHLLNGLAYGMLLFLLAIGLSLIFGVMDVLHLSHGSFYLWAAYLALTIAGSGWGFWVGLVVAPLAVGVGGLVLARLFLRPLFSRGHLDQALLTLGVAFVLADGARWIWGSRIRSLPPPAELASAVSILGHPFPSYRLFVIAIGLVLAAVVWMALERSRVGAIIRAGVTDRQMVSGLGIDVDAVFVGVFAVGAALAGLGGVLASPILTIGPGTDFQVLILALIVVVIGKTGSFSGTMWGSLLVGEVTILGAAIAPRFASFVLFGLMATVLILRPTTGGQGQDG